MHTSINQGALPAPFAPPPFKTLKALRVWHWEQAQSLDLAALNINKELNSYECKLTSVQRINEHGVILALHQQAELHMSAVAVLNVVVSGRVEDDIPDTVARSWVNGNVSSLCARLPPASAFNIPPSEPV